MVSLQEQIRRQKENKSEKLKDLLYVDYCNNCKDPEVRGTYGKHYTPCTHPWYCWNDGGEVQALESRIAQLKHMEWLYPIFPAKEKQELRELESKRWDLIRECRRNMPKIKHEAKK